jgi:hypothetical protein
MSVTCVLYAATDAEIDALILSPRAIQDFLRRATPMQEPGCIGGLLGRRPIPLPETRPIHDLGKSWDVVHYVLTGTAKEAPLPAGFLKSGGVVIGDEDIGYGPARALKAATVAAVAALVEGTDGSRFRASMKPREMRPLHVYGAPVTDDLNDAEYLVDDYLSLRTFLSERRHTNEGVIIQYV